MWKYARARTDELFHYGVKGMKWGVRRTPEQLGHSPKVAKAGKRVILKEKSSGGEKGLKCSHRLLLEKELEVWRNGLRTIIKRFRHLKNTVKIGTLIQSEQSQVL